MEREIFQYSRLREGMVMKLRYIEVNVHELDDILNKLSYGKIRRLFIPRRVKLIVFTKHTVDQIFGEKFILSTQYLSCQMDVEDKRKVTLIGSRYNFWQPVKIEENKFEVKSRNN